MVCEVATDADLSAALVTFEIYIGARNNGNDLGSNFLNAELSYFLIGGGFNLANLDTMLDTVESEFSL